MSQLIIDGVQIDAPLKDILSKIRIETNYVKDIDSQGSKDYIRVTCPFHKNGQENDPSCSVYARTDNDNVTFGTYHCFTCQCKGPLTKFVSQCFEMSEGSAKEWLKARFGTKLQVENPINILLNDPEKHKSTKFLDESILKQYEYYHPYMWKRKLTKEVVDRFQIGYNKQHESITFPVFDRYHRLVMVTERNVNTKQFHIPPNVEKPVYLLDAVLQDNARTVYVCESQINALTLWGYGYPAIALFGTGSEYQYNILKKCNIKQYVLCFDGDTAGRSGAIKFVKHIGAENVYKDVVMPEGRDVNDLTQSEFENLLSGTRIFNM